ncbi:G-type lectin S-receptor-like serine/threonine-protein kinase At4g27290 isoform X2 [Rhododendron vialii]|uniref:G-type lectin S-receptor-like serine/threonine-protein kinase At4g27290 isoform X2 n=1 Tax=Rhododendron vialii TaxID=182163 RepID=UPI0026601DB2|nr:G-type lectin S-receptor-like serine/threonine-protein kinase At4g27290 isoform X2 [Rhododendron vialii]
MVLPIILLSLFTSLSLSIESTTALDALSLNQTLADATGETLVSADESFELGFFSPPNSGNRYIGIWFKQVSLQTPIWVANKDNPVTDTSGVLTISPTGNIIITSNQTNLIWSSNSTMLSASPVLQLLDTGNLVVVNSNTGSYSWQSFDHPCDTIVPGMKLGWDISKNQEWYLTSWNSLQDPSTGDYTYRVDPRGLPQLVLRRGSTISYRSGPWDGVRFGGGPPLKENTVFSPNFVYNTTFVYYSFVNIDDTIISRFVVNQTGLIEHLTWNQGSGEWVDIVTLQGDSCDTYDLCGPYAICNINELPICHCMDGFVPKVPVEWNRLDWSGGCVAKTELNCSVAAGFRRFSRLKLPDTSYFLVNRTEISRVDCEEACLKNCSCMGFAQTDISGCVVWSGELLDMREYYEGGQDLYVRLAASELGSNKTKRRALIASVMVISGVLALGLISWCVIRKRRRITAQRRAQRLETASQQVQENNRRTAEEDLELPLFDLATISTATNNFSYENKIGEGGFGPVYKGQLSSGQEVAVKRLAKTSGQGIKEFKNEVIFIAKLQHRNLVRLLGCCIHEEERMLIYEYMQKRSLDLHIFNQTRGTSLDWQKRFDIIVGIARGLLYLHRDSRLRIIHRDLKASNILLDDDMNPKISDFGLARIFGDDQSEENTNRVLGTYGYMSPEYAINGLFSVKSDVFSFGVLVLEIVSGKKNRGFYHPDHDLNLLGHAWKLWNEGKPMNLVDALMESPIPTPEVVKCIQMALLCVQDRPEDRPPMSAVLLMLDSENAILPPPKQPGFYTERFPPETDSSSTSIYPLISNEVTISAVHGR